MAKKPARYGIKIFALADARTFFACNLEVYAGTQPQGPYHVNNSPVEVVKRLTEKLNSESNVTVDNWYTSYELAKYLLQKNITLVGTIKKNKREILKEFVNSKNHPVTACHTQTVERLLGSAKWTKWRKYRQQSIDRSIYNHI
ncbi:uncharacterized protein LOC118181397 [Stegodyphus dumicola]|uniref:uncharacterized protein LOC118181397 n=1 Tax=Stegodyphus dumicola TaxID=202533 RepID=UPI0015A8A801|nr:uncharacterized protein LOC118181397 [Stegodyphus dumicola]